MTGIEVIILIVVIVAGAAAIGYYMTKNHPTLEEMTKDYYDNEQAQEVVELAQELYNKDLRPVVAKKAPKQPKQVVSEPTKAVEEVKKETKSEFPIDKPKKKRKYYPKKK